MKKKSYQNQPLNNKNNNRGNYLKSNVETGAYNWNWEHNQKNYRMNQDDLKAYKQQQLSNAKKVGGGILNTNVETGNWNGMQFIVPEKSDRIGPGDIQAQEKFFAGQLKETITGPLPGQRGQNAPVKFNNNNNWGGNYNQNYNNNNYEKYEFVQQKNTNQQKYNYPQNDNYYQQNNNYGYQDNKNYGYQDNVNNNMSNQNYNQGNNNFDGNLDNLNAEPGVMKVEASERFIYENGVKKKLTKIKKYMESGEVVEEIYKTDL
jgi:hypothetical protein